MSNRLDIVIFGATGFTGKRIIEELHNLLHTEKLTFTWAIAGRSEKKLKEVLEETAKKCETDFSSVPVIIADVNDANSLREMTSQARVIINAVGPYGLFGEPVVKACTETSTNYIDITAEISFIKSMSSKYHEIAAQKGIYVVNACGLDCIPADLGVVFLQQNFGGVLNSVEGYVKFTLGSSPGPVGNYGTWASAVNEWGDLRRTVAEHLRNYEESISNLKPTTSSKGFLHRRSVVDGGCWATPLFTADGVVATRTQKFFHENYKQRPIHLNGYACINSYFYLLLCAIYLLMFEILVRFECGRNLLLKYPGFFSYGLFDHGGPSERKQNETKLEITLTGEGWSDVQEQYMTPPDKIVKATVMGYNPGYRITGIATVLGAFMVLTEKSKMPKNGGVLSTGAAFAKTSFIEKLHKYGLKFEIL